MSEFENETEIFSKTQINESNSSLPFIQINRPNSDPLLLPICFTTDVCQCFQLKEHEVISEEDENYLSKTVEWLKKELNSIYLHINKDKYLNTSHFKYTKIGIIFNAYNHLISSFNIFSNRFNVLPKRYQNIRFKYGSDHEIHIVNYVKVILNLCKSYSDMLIVLMKKDESMKMSYLINVLNIHINYITPLIQILEHFKNEINYISSLNNIQ